MDVVLITNFLLLQCKVRKNCVNATPKKFFLMKGFTDSALQYNEKEGKENKIDAVLQPFCITNKT